MTDIDKQIKEGFQKALCLLAEKADKWQLCKAVEALGGQSDILGIIGSYKDTISDEGTLQMLNDYNTWAASIT